MAYYSDELIEEIRSGNDIVDVISGYVRLTKKGSTYFGLCPFHNEKTPSFSVSPNKQMYYCFGCGAGGNVFTFLMQYENFTFPEAMQELAMIDDGVDFFDFSECMNDLVTSGHLTLSEDGLYAITEKGLRNGQICESSLPYSVRLAADKNITLFNQKLRRRAQIRSEITPRPNGTYTVSLAFCDEQDSPLLKMELMVPKEVMAKDLADRFRKNTEQLYASVINALFEAPREKKE